MRAVGIVVEYNPFHNGHAYHVQQAKNYAKDQIVVAVMSGHFLQRGEPALVDKWTRTEMALAQGVDIVIELPYVFSTAQAKQFAFGAIALLDALHCDAFMFGSEDGNVQPFINSLTLMTEEKEQYDALIKEFIATGISYPQALQKAYCSLQQAYVGQTTDLSMPNNILGFHYLQAAQLLQSHMQPLTVQRIGAGYHDSIDSTTHIASATGIRQSLFAEGDLQRVAAFVPRSSFSLLEHWLKQYNTFAHWEAFWPFLKHTLLRYTPEQLTQFADVTEGLEYALIKHVKNAHSYQEFMNKLKSKRYTWTRLQRMLTHIYTGVTKEQLHSFTEPSYIRLLGMTARGQQYIALKKKEVKLPLISRVGALNNDMLALDIRASEIYAQSLQLYTDQMERTDYNTPPIRFKAE